MLIENSLADMRLSDCNDVKKPEIHWSVLSVNERELGGIPDNWYNHL